MSKFTLGQRQFPTWAYGVNNRKTMLAQRSHAIRGSVKNSCIVQKAHAFLYYFRTSISNHLSEKPEIFLFYMSLNKGFDCIAV